MVKFSYFFVEITIVLFMRLRIVPTFFTKCLTFMNFCLYAKIKVTEIFCLMTGQFEKLYSRVFHKIKFLLEFN